MTALSSTRVAFYSESLQLLQTYDFNGSTWAASGTDFSLTTNTSVNASVSSFSATLVAFFNNGVISAYTLDPPRTNIGAREFLRGMSSRQEG